MKKFILALLILASAWALGGLSWAAEKYPNKPITFLVPWGAGGMTDVTSRLLAEKFKSELGQPVLVVNKPGANGAIGLKYALSQKADGYTVVIGPMTDGFAGPYFLGGEPFDFKDGPGYEGPYRRDGQGGPGPSFLGHLVPVDAGHYGGGFPGYVEEDGGGGAAVHGAVIDAGKKDHGPGGIQL